MNSYKIEKLVSVMLIQSQHYQNFIAKFNFVSMLDYQTTKTNIEEKDLIISSPSSHILYLIDVENPHHYIKSLLNQNIFPLPLFHHVWHQLGTVGNAQMYNTLLAADGYLNLSAIEPQYQVYAFLFDGNRYSEAQLEVTNKYNNMWTIYDEMLPPLNYLMHLKVEKVKIICDQKRSDLIISATNLYEEILEIEVI